MIPENLAGEWARIVASALVESGVREVVVSPGSRSTPFIVEIARADLAVIDVVDERSAAFVALGIARATGRTVALLCTSGTAPAHWYPAVIEASLAALPLVLLTADRPFELAHCGAPQTIDQTKLFGDHVRFFADAGTPDASDAALRGLRRTIIQSVHASRGARPGPVHVNLRARKPLEPREATSEEALALRAAVDRILASPPTAGGSTRIEIDGSAIDAAAQLVARSRRPVFVLGPLPARAVDDGTRAAALALALACGAPIFAEATSQLRFASRTREVVFADALDRIVAHPDLAPDLVIQIGGTPTSGALDRFVAERPELPRIVVAGAWSDPHSTARAMLLGEIAPTSIALAAATVRRAREIDSAWRERIVRADRAVWSRVDEELETAGFGEGTVARTLVAALPARSSLTVGNSLPVRMLDRYVPGGAELTVLSQRGANGIDGLVSGAIGAGLATGSVGALLVGDLGAQHDLGGLASAALLRSPLAIVVVQNGGGRIFEQLAIARDPALAWAMPHFVMPQRVRFDAIAAAFDLPYEQVRDAAALRSALDRALARPGATIVEAVVPPHGARDAEARLDARIRAALEAT